MSSTIDDDANIQRS